MDNTTKPQNGPAGTLSSLIVGLYAWVVAVSFGAVLLDVVYSNLVSEVAAAFSEVADFLLYISAVTVLTALGAIGLSWNSRIARIFLSLACSSLFLNF